MVIDGVAVEHVQPVLETFLEYARDEQSGPVPPVSTTCVIWAGMPGL